MVKLYIIGGVPGSGKTTLAKQMVDNGQADVYYEADMYFEDENGNYSFDPKLLPHAHQWCKNAVAEALKAGKTVIVSNTFTRKWERQSYFDLANEVGIEYEFIKCLGEYENVHGVPAEKVEQMKARWED